MNTDVILLKYKAESVTQNVLNYHALITVIKPVQVSLFLVTERTYSARIIHVLMHLIGHFLIKSVSNACDLMM